MTKLLLCLLAHLTALGFIDIYHWNGLGDYSKHTQLQLQFYIDPR